MKKINSLVLGLCLTAESMAAPVTLKCFTDAGRPVTDLIVDLDAQTLIWGRGFEKYNVINVTENYITAYEIPNIDVGGGVWVLDRRNGKFKRANVGMFMSENQTPEDAVLGADILSGTCTRQVL